MVEEEDLDLAAVVCIDDAGAGIDEVLGCEAGAGGDAAICLLGENGIQSVICYLVVVSLVREWRQDDADGGK